MKIRLTQKYSRISILGIPIHIKHGCLFRYIIKKLLQKRLREKIINIENKEKIRVGFLVAESSKWGYQSVYEAFAQNPRFEPMIVVTKLSSEHLNGKNYYKTMADCAQFFKNKNMHVESGYDDKKKTYIPLNQLNLDIIFYEQPWDLADCQHPLHTSKYAITCYSSYGFDLMNYAGSYMENFHRLLDFVFTVSDATYNYIIQIAKDIDNLHVVGWPKLDCYHNIKRKRSKKPTIIYAPHHSFEPNGLNLATFQYNGQKILNLAKEHSNQFNWIFKPHPRLKHALILNNIMTEEQVEYYYTQWNDIGQICDSGDYFEIFQNSHAMITDCCSFLGEYLPTGKPVLHLINTKAQFNNVAHSFINTYYQIYDNNELERVFDRVLINLDDYKKTVRQNKISLVFDKNEKTGQKIYNKILNLLNNKRVQ